MFMMKHARTESAKQLVVESCKRKVFVVDVAIRWQDAPSEIKMLARRNWYVENTLC